MSDPSAQSIPSGQTGDASPHQPIEVLRYRLTPDHARVAAKELAMPDGWWRWVLIAAGAGFGLLVGLTGAGAAWSMANVLTQIGLAVFVFIAVRAAIVLRRRIVAARLPLGDVRLERWSDHLAVAESGATRHVALEMIGRTLILPDLVLFLTPGAPILVPLGAFADRTEMEAFARVIDAAAAAATK